jgi:hypothetical protein
MQAILAISSKKMTGRSVCDSASVSAMYSQTYNTVLAVNRALIPRHPQELQLPFVITD